MGASEKVAATFHPGRGPVMPPAGLPEKSGVEALLGAADRTLAQHQNMQNALDEIRKLVGFWEFSAVSKKVVEILDKHHI